jgi:hypothetical protein
MAVSWRRWWRFVPTDFCKWWLVPEVLRSTTRARRATLTLADFKPFTAAFHLYSEHIMRIFPIALIVIGSLGIAKYLGLIPIGMFQLIGPLLLIALGVALFFRRPRRCRGDWHTGSDSGSTSVPQPPSTGSV